jgi:hypothetical protein
MRAHLIIQVSFFFLVLFGSFQANAQWGVSYHQSALPFVGVNYTFAERFMPELRLGTDRYFEDITLEGTFNYQYVQREEYQLYAGLGLLVMEGGAGVLIPAGLLIYPFENKKFGFHIEATPVIVENNHILRGSWGIRYRFLKD